MVPRRMRRRFKTGGMARRGSSFRQTGQGYDNGGRLAQRLVDDAVALGEAVQRGELFGGRFGVEVEGEADALKAHRHFFGDAKSAAKIQIAFGAHGSAA